MSAVHSRLGSGFIPNILPLTGKLDGEYPRIDEFAPFSSNLFLRIQIKLSAQLAGNSFSFTL
jgi:hypothetical protein